MEFIVPDYFIEKLKADYAEGAEEIQEKLFGFLTERGGWNKLFPYGAFPPKEKLIRHTKKEEPYVFYLTGNTDNEYHFEYTYKDGISKFILSLRDMQRLLTDYEHNRKSMRPMENDLIYWLLYEFVYHALPDNSKKLWETIRKVQRGLPTIIMQDIGINLRTWGQPIVFGDSLSKDIQQDGFLTIAKRINLCLKVLRDYLQKLKEFEILLSQNPKKYRTSLTSLRQKTQQVMVVIDSIKNPFESMYLKARYSSYYLIIFVLSDGMRYLLDEFPVPIGTFLIFLGTGVLLHTAIMKMTITIHSSNALER